MAYSSNLKASILLPSQTKTLDTFIELAKAPPDYTITVHEGSIAYDYLRTSQEKTYMDIYSKVVKFSNSSDRFYQFQRIQELYYVGFSGGIGTAKSQIRDQNSNPLLRTSFEVIADFGVCFPVPNNAPYIGIIDDGFVQFPKLISYDYTYFFL